MSTEKKKLEGVLALLYDNWEERKMACKEGRDELGFKEYGYR
jgi:hypothetical protein